MKFFLKRMAQKLVALRQTKAQSIQPCLASQDWCEAERNAPTSSGFFILFGCPRSGTTLVSQCLSAHSQILVPYETDILVPCAFILNRIKEAELGKEMIADMVINSYYFDWSLGKYLSAAEVRQAVKQADYTVPAIFTNLFTLAGQKIGKPIVGDKSPNDIFDIQALAGTGLLAEPVKIIHLVRDLRDVMVSLKRQNWSADVDMWFPRLWAERNLYLQGCMHGAPNYFFLRYEDFVADPLKWLRELSAFLNVEFEAPMLDTTAFPEHYKTLSAHRNLHRPIGMRHIGEWKTQSTPQQIQAYEKQAGEALLKFGYMPTPCAEGLS